MFSPFKQIKYINNSIHENKAPHEPSWLELARERAFQAELELALNWLEGLKAWLEKLEPAREPIN